MESVKSRFRKLSLNHVCFVGLCAVIVYLFRAGDTYYLKPVWRKRVESQQFANGAYPTDEDRLPPPVITDLESDGVNEIVLITNDMKLTILALPEMQNKDEGTLPHVIVKHKVTLPLLNAKGDVVSRPIVMRTGFTEPYQSMVQVRSQVIVLATEDWQVLCYSPALELVWRTSLMPAESLKEAYVMTAMDVLVSSHSVKKNDGGLVIIGGSMLHKTHLQTEEEMLHLRNHTEESLDRGHFSTFAVSGRNGSLRWSHLPGDFGEQPQDIKARPFNSSRQENGGEHHWKLGLRKNRLHKGEVPWRVYKDKIKSLLPHMWTGLADTKFKLARFQKEAPVPETDDEDEDQEPFQSTALKPEHIVGYAYGGLRPHSDAEHVDNPNAVVIHRDTGVEVLNLLSGRPMTRMEFLPDSSIYMDVDGDWEPEKITWGQFKDHTVCYLEIWRQQPIKEKLDQLAVCISKRMVWTRSWALEEDFYKKLPPYITQNVAKKKGIISHLLGRHLSSDSRFDVVSVTSLGRVSSFDLEGNIHWQAQTVATWSTLAVAVRKDRKRKQASTKEFFDSFMPSRVPMSVKVFGHKDTLAVAGFNGISVVDLKEGHVLAEHTIPAPPTAPLFVGDFNNDGLNDVVLTCKMGYIGFVLQSKTNHEFTAMYATAVFLSIFVITMCMSPDVWSKSEEDEE
ncbi:uncharacterized protein LOC124262710 isoform X1 [Haliotis rubra]|uniref:uncharacterized protein LOC124262710 isoform X1 n=1 Tax=Haliotis rubra TaxID=36100 RepID=UPI001EE548D4|nr:uncharacterized protein LOC124262710 isoform X1 [Haliotis rubra]XP_046553204.1 uncharacterized protein LOC124262710 isoform X1 [Haliotis rubra]XP_046553213.1 uncharacterized protein LOC124262710 isoform X1 [Haliotis rubra]